MNGCPSPDRILRYVGGDTGVPDLDPHLAGCPRCGQDVDLALAVSHFAAEQSPVERRGAAGTGLAARIRRLRHQARLALEGAPAAWWQNVLDSPDRHDPSFLFEVADRMVWLADETPQGVLRLAPIVRGMTEQLSGAPASLLQGATLARIAKGRS